MPDINNEIDDEGLLPSDHDGNMGEPSHSASNTFTYNAYTVGWVCALPKEQIAATAMLDHIHPDLPKPRTDHNTYTLGSIDKHNIVIACLPKGKIGNNPAATAATQMIRTFPSIKVGLMVGIGGGIPPKVQLGDVVVSTPIDQYPGVVQWDFGKTEKDGFRRTGALNSPPSVMLTALSKLETSHEMEGSKIHQYLKEMKKKWPRLSPAYTTPGSSANSSITLTNAHHNESRSQALFSMLWNMIFAFLGLLLGWRLFPSINGSTDSVEQVERTPASAAVDGGQRKPGDLQVHYGLIASGNQVIKDAEFRDSLDKKLGGHLLCVEMEAAGLMDNFPCVVIRGICDYADSRKNKDWQEYAATVAAAYAKELLHHLQPSDVEQESPLKDIMEQVLGSVEEVKSKINSKQDLEILNWLTPLEYDLQQNDYFQRRQADTGQWFLDSQKFQQWLKASSKTLFCPGLPGAGKTILTSVVVNHLAQRFSKDPSVGIAYIYCNFRRTEEQNIRDLLGSLLKQLAGGYPSLPSEVKDLYHRHEARRTRPSLEEILDALHCVAAKCSRVFILVDALDECQVSDGCRNRLLSELCHLQEKHEANILATSRPVPEISGHLKVSESLEIRASTDDVRRYLESNMGQLPTCVGRNRQLQEEIKMRILEAVDGMFLLAKLYLGLLEDKLTPNDIRSALKLFQNPGQLSGEDMKTQILAQAYEQTMERINRQKQGLTEVAMSVLSWITCAKTPLTTLELQHALATKTGKSELDQGDVFNDKDMVSACAGLVTVDEKSDVIRLVHYTLQEYFEKTQKCWFPNAEVDITRTCLTYLSFKAFETGSCQTDEEFEKRLRLNPLYNYAAQNWAHHAHGAPSLSEEVVEFLRHESQVGASSQALMASRWDSRFLKDGQNPLGQTTGLHLAAYFGLEKAANTLLILEYDPDPTDCRGRTPLSYAAERGHEAVVKLLLANDTVNLNLKLAGGYTPLCWAVRHNNEAVVKMLLETKQIDLNSKCAKGHTPLCWAVRHNNEAVLKMLLETKQIDLNSKCAKGHTPLCWAVRRNNEAVVKMLLETKQIDRNSECGDGYTPLWWALRGNNEAVVKMLLATDGIDPNSEYFEYD